MKSPACVVFGGSGAVGREVCRALAARGARVGFTFLRAASVAEELVREIPGSIAKLLDIRDVGAIDRTLDEFAAHFGTIDAFVQCAGIGVSAPFEGPTVHHRMEQIDEHAWGEMIDVNLKSSFFAVRKVASLMGDRGGNIVLIGSIDGLKPVPSPVHYAASKGGLAGMVQAMAKELGPRNIRVTSVAPGILEAGLSRVVPDDMRREYLKHCGLRRVGRMDEIAPLVAWLALENTLVTGRTMIVDGAL